VVTENLLVETGSAVWFLSKAGIKEVSRKTSTWKEKGELEIPGIFLCLCDIEAKCQVCGFREGWSVMES
jgi:hypothetical protein